LALLVERSNKDAPVGHMFVGFIEPDGTIRARGFYSKGGGLGAIIEGEGLNGRIKNDGQSFVRALKGDENFKFRMYDVDKQTYQKAWDYINSYDNNSDYGVISNSCVSAAWSTMSDVGLESKVIQNMPAVTPNSIFKIFGRDAIQHEYHWPENGRLSR
jgi:hypothetical protein